MDCKENATEQKNQEIDGSKCLEKSVGEKIEEIYQMEVLPESDAGSGETIADLGKTEDGADDLDDLCEPNKKKMRMEVGELQKENKNYYVHVELSMRERAFNALVKQRFAIQIIQCDVCRANRTHLIVQAYEADWLVLVNLCEKCLHTNMEIGKLYNTFWPKYEQKNICRINHQLPNEGIYEIERNEDANPLQRKILSNRLCILLTQCGRCAGRQLDMYSDVFIRKNKDGTFFLSYVQCLSCLCGNDKILSELFKSSWKNAKEKKIADEPGTSNTIKE